MMRWLQRLLQSDDPIVKLIGGIGEHEAEMYRELLENDGVPAMAKNMTGASVTQATGIGNDYDLFVKQSDLERARAILTPMLDPDS